MKIRGFRIELGEIEAALLAHPAVREAVGGRARGRSRATGAWSPTWCRRGGASTSAELRALPAASGCRTYMVPAAFVRARRAAADRQRQGRPPALPAPDEPARPRRRGYVAPRDAGRGAAGRRSGARCCGVERVGRDDDFFALGGHSLLATQVALAAARGAAASSCRCATLFEAPDRRGPGRADRGGTARPAPLRSCRSAGAARPGRRRCRSPSPSSGSGSSTSSSRAAAAYNIPGAVRLDGRARRRGARARRWREVVRRHEALRTTFAECRRAAGAGDRRRRAPFACR